MATFWDGLVDFAKQAKAVPQALLFACGIHGGSYANEFPSEFVWSAGLISTMTMVIGAVLLVFIAVKATIYPDGG